MYFKYFVFRRKDDTKIVFEIANGCAKIRSTFEGNKVLGRRDKYIFLRRYLP